MNTFMQSAPQAAALVLDLFAEAQDWPNAEKIGKRLEHLLPPELRAREAAERGEQPAPAPPNPQDAVAAQAEAAQAAAMQQQAAQLRLQAELQKLALENEGRALENERRKIELAAAARGAVKAEHDPRSAPS